MSKKKITQSLLLFIGIFFIFSCQNELYKKVSGVWTIDEMYSKDGTLSGDMLSTIASINDDGTFKFPELTTASAVPGTWQIYSDDTLDFMTVKGTESFYDGTYQISFEKNYDKKLLLLVLENDKIYLRSAKFLQDFDKKEKDW